MPTFLIHNLSTPQKENCTKYLGMILELKHFIKFAKEKVVFLKEFFLKNNNKLKGQKQFNFRKNFPILLKKYFKAAEEKSSKSHLGMKVITNRNSHFLVSCSNPVVETLWYGRKE